MSLEDDLATVNIYAKPTRKTHDRPKKNVKQNEMYNLADYQYEAKI